MLWKSTFAQAPMSFSQASKSPFFPLQDPQTMMLQKNRVAFLNCPSQTRRAETPVSLDCKGSSVAMEGVYSTWSCWCWIWVAEQQKEGQNPGCSAPEDLNQAERRRWLHLHFFWANCHRSLNREGNILSQKERRLWQQALLSCLVFPSFFNQLDTS